MDTAVLIIIIALAVVAVGVVAALLGRFLYLRQMRVSLIQLLGKREAVHAAARGLERVLEHLLSADDETLGSFASNPASEDRRALDDVSQRMTILADDLHGLAVPKRLWPAAERMEEAARVIATQAGRVGETATPDAALDGLAAIRIDEITAALDSVSEALDPLLTEFKVSDPGVYGGGLYI